MPELSPGKSECDSLLTDRTPFTQLRCLFGLISIHKGNSLVSGRACLQHTSITCVRIVVKRPLGRGGSFSAPPVNQHHTAERLRAWLPRCYFERLSAAGCRTAFDYSRIQPCGVELKCTMPVPSSNKASVLARLLLASDVNVPAASQEPVRVLQEGPIPLPSSSLLPSA